MLHRFGYRHGGTQSATAIPAGQGEKVERRITIRRSPEELYHFWRDLENLPRIMDNLKKVGQCDAQRSHWVVNGPLGTELEWDAEIYNHADEMIAWRSLPGGDLETAGSIHFKPSRHTGCTEVTLSMKFNPPAGKVAPNSRLVWRWSAAEARRRPGTLQAHRGIRGHDRVVRF